MGRRDRRIGLEDMRRKIRKLDTLEWLIFIGMVLTLIMDWVICKGLEF